MIRLETLEPRAMMASGWANAYDVTGDFHTSAADAIAVINSLATETPPIHYDVNDSGHVTSLDALTIINHLGQPQPKHVVTFELGATDVHGLPADAMTDIINAAFADWEETGDVDFRIVERGGGQKRISTGPLYLGFVNGQHWQARGWVRDGLGGGDIQLHNGQLRAHQHNGTLGPINQDVNWNPYSIPSGRKILRHELGHSVRSWGHTSSNINCVMHPHATANRFCAGEVASIQQAYGVSRL